MNRAISARTDPQAARGYWTMNRRDSARAFQAARRHSRIVRILRITLPLVVALAFVTITLMTYFNPLRSLGGIPANISATVVHGSQVTMEQPKLSGYTRDERRYNLTADSAAQDLAKPDIIRLNNIRAGMEMKDKSTVHMTALKGVYDSKKELLKLDDNIRLSSSNGYSGVLSEATVDIKKGNVLSDHPVRLKMMHGTLEANRLRITQSGDVILFDRGVEMTVMLNGSELGKPGNSGAGKAGAGNGAQ
ncbi:MAG: LPS export ABC transporter periplasmic protein LptC [Pseudolabrys sp.]